MWIIWYKWFLLCVSIKFRISVFFKNKNNFCRLGQQGLESLFDLFPTKSYCIVCLKSTVPFTTMLIITNKNELSRHASKLNTNNEDASLLLVFWSSRRKAPMHELYNELVSKILITVLNVVVVNVCWMCD